MAESTSSGARPRVFCSWGYPESGLALLRARCDVEVWEGKLPAPPEVTQQRIADGVDGVFAMPPTDRLDEPILAAAPRLRAVTGFGVGFDYIDVDAATRHGVAVTNTPGVLVDTTAELAFGLMLAAARRLSEADRYVRSGQWGEYEPGLLWGRDLFGSTLGIVGMGAIGQAVTRRAVAFGMDVIYTSRTRKLDVEGRYGARYASLAEVLAESDFVSVHCALTAETQGLIGAAEFGAMRQGAILGQHGTWPDCGSAGARGGVARRPAGGRRLGRVRGRAATAGRSAADARQRGDGPAHRERYARHARADGRAGGARAARRAGRAAAGAPGQPGGVGVGWGGFPHPPALSQGERGWIPACVGMTQLHLYVGGGRSLPRVSSRGRLTPSR